MTAPTRPDDNKTTTAKVLFIGFFAAALGWAGVLVAAIAVATEQTWTKGRPERARAAERQSSWLDTQRDWLAADHQQRMARAAAHRDWLRSGADPASRPAGPGRASRSGAALRRGVANVAVAGADFGRGFRDGWKAADVRRRQGAGFRDTAATRPQQPHSPAGQHTNQRQPQRRTGPGTVVHPTDRTEAQILQTGDWWAWTCRNAYCPGKGFDYSSRKAAEEGAKQHKCRRDAEPVNTADDRSADTEPGQESTPEGEPMPDDNTPTPPAPQRPAGDSNATVLAGKLAAITTTVNSMSDDTDALHTAITTINRKITAAADLASAAGMPTAAITAVDTAHQAAALVTARLDDFAAGTTATVDHLTAATNGLRAVQAAEDRLRSSGADGRVFETSGV